VFSGGGAQKVTRGFVRSGERGKSACVCFIFTLDTFEKKNDDIFSL
jgi:hypothetical protein